MHAHKQRNGKASHGWGANLYDSTMWVEVIGLRSSSWGDRNLQELVCCHLARLEDTPLSNWTAGGGPEGLILFCHLLNSESIPDRVGTFVLPFVSITPANSFTLHSIHPGVVAYSLLLLARFLFTQEFLHSPSRLPLPSLCKSSASILQPLHSLLGVSD